MLSSGRLLRPRQGLTLIEVVVFMVIITIMVYVALPLYQNWYQQAKSIEASGSENPVSIQEVAKSEQAR